MGNIEWLAEVQGPYGGPAMVANVSDYEKWSGSAPYPLEKRTALHYWGQFSAELPAPFQLLDGGHAFRRCSDIRALRAERDALITTIEAKFTGARTTINDETGEAHVLLPDKRQLWIEFSPTSQYDEACIGDTVWEHTFKTNRGSEGSAVFWDKEGPGSFFVGVNETRDELLLLRTWVDKDEFKETAKTFVDSPTKHEETVDEVHLQISDGQVVIAYSPHQWWDILGGEFVQTVITEVNAGLSEEDGREKLLKKFRSLLEPATGQKTVLLGTDGNSDIAAVLRLLPGKYATATGCYDPDQDQEGKSQSWSCIWCRFKALSS